MNRFTIITAALLAAFLAIDARAADPTKEDIENAGKRAEIIAQLALAADLTAIGRGEMADETGLKSLKSPEMLVAAGGILLRANASFGGKMETIKDAPTDAKGQPIKGEAKSVDLKAQAEALFDEARGMAAGDKGKLAAINDLIKQAQTLGDKRDSVGGCKTITRTLQPGETHTYKFSFYSGQTASVCMTSSGPAKIQFSIDHVGGTNLLNTRVVNANYSWTPQRDKNNVRQFSVTLQNLGKKETTYSLRTN